MKNRILLGLCLTALLLPAGVFAAPAPQGGPVVHTVPPLLSPEPPKWEDRRIEVAFEASRMRQVVADLPSAASVDEVVRIAEEAHITRAAEKQLALLTRFSTHVRAGGRLVYATCSLSSNPL